MDIKIWRLSDNSALLVPSPQLTLIVLNQRGNQIAVKLLVGACVINPISRLSTHDLINTSF